jgi:hypothetical protein
MIATEGSRDGQPTDEVLLDDVRQLFEALDPAPSQLGDRIRLTLALRDLAAELAHFVDPVEEIALAARGTEQSRIVTFDSDSLTIMIRIDANTDGTARVDGWLAPPHPRPVEMKLTDSSITVTADELGRFVFHSVPRGTARLIVRPQKIDVASERSNEEFGAMTLVITPALTLLIGLAGE